MLPPFSFASALHGMGGNLRGFSPRGLISLAILSIRIQRDCHHGTKIKDSESARCNKNTGNWFAAVNMESAGLSLLDNFNQTGLHIAPLYGALQIMDVLG